MRTKNLLVLPALFVGLGASAQTATNAPAAASPHIRPVVQPDQTSIPENQMDPVKLAGFQKRFQEGFALQKDGKLAEARKVYDSILADEPNARRSLLEAGKVSILLNEPAKADEYLGRLHTLEPEFPEATELLIQVNQTLKHDVKVELLIRDFRELRASGRVSGLAKSLQFIRERFAVGKQQVIVSQFFDYTQAPNTVWMAEVFDAAGNLQRRLLLNYDPDATRALRAKDAKYATTEVYTWFEHVMVNGQVKSINAYLNIFALPDYAKFRSAMLVILANPPTPIYSAPVSASE